MLFGETFYTLREMLRGHRTVWYTALEVDFRST